MPFVRVHRRPCGLILPLVAGLGLKLAACASAPPGPRGPLLGPGVEIGMDLASSYGDGAVALPDGTHASVRDQPLRGAIPFARRAEGRLSPVPWFDLGGQIGWMGGGADLRLGRPATPETMWPFVLNAGFETGRVALINDYRGSRLYWLRLEAYPRLALRTTGLRLVLAVGVDGGTYYHSIADPRFEGTQETISLLRPETRIETSIGIALLPPRIGFVVVTLSPYVVAHAGAPRARCQSCPEIASYSESWGVVFVARLVLRRSVSWRALAEGSVTVE